MKWFLFDYADTLAELAPSKFWILQNFLSCRFPELAIDPVAIQRAYFDLEADFTRSSLVGSKTVSRKDFYLESNRKLLEKLSVFEPGTEEELFQSFIQTETHWELKKNAHSILSQVFATSNKIGLLSNFDSTLREKLTNQGIYHFFDAIHISQEVNLQKPSREFYDSFFRKEKILYPEAIYFADNYRLDYEPMIKLGAEVVLLDEFGFYDLRIPTIPTIRSLSEIANYIK